MLVREYAGCQCQVPPYVRRERPESGVLHGEMTEVNELKSFIIIKSCCKIKHKISGTPPAYLQEVNPGNQLSSCWENNQSAAFISIKSIFFTNLDKRVQLHHQNIQNHVIVFDPSRIGQELRLRAWQKRHQGPTYESQGWDVLGCLGECVWHFGTRGRFVDGVSPCKIHLHFYQQSDSKVTLFFTSLS